MDNVGFLRLHKQISLLTTETGHQADIYFVDTSKKAHLGSEEMGLF